MRFEKTGVEILRDISARFRRYLYSTKCSWIIKGFIRPTDFVTSYVQRIPPLLSPTSEEFQRFFNWESVPQTNAVAHLSAQITKVSMTCSQHHTISIILPRTAEFIIIENKKLSQ